MMIIDEYLCSWVDEYLVKTITVCHDRSCTISLSG